MPIEYALRAAPFIAYDGSNSADVHGVTIASEEGGVLTLVPTDPSVDLGDPLVVNTGDHVTVWQAVSAVDWATEYVKA